MSRRAELVLEASISDTRVAVWADHSEETLWLGTAETPESLLAVLGRDCEPAFFKIERRPLALALAGRFPELTVAPYPSVTLRYADGEEHAATASPRCWMVGCQADRLIGASLLWERTGSIYMARSVTSLAGYLIGQTYWKADSETGTAPLSLPADIIRRLQSYR